MFGVVICAIAGRLAELPVVSLPVCGKTSQTRGLIFAICSRLALTMMNFGLVSGEPLLSRA